MKYAIPWAQVNGPTPAHISELVADAQNAAVFLLALSSTAWWVTGAASSMA